MATPPTPPVTPAARANRSWWDSDAERYTRAHAAYLSSFYWCPEMLHEKDAQLLGSPASLADATVLEIGCGTAACTRWLSPRTALATGFDISAGMLRRATEDGEILPLAQADAAALPYRDGCFDIAFSAFGAFPFLPDLTPVFAEVARVLRPGGRFVFAVPHPMRWVFPDDPDSLTASIPYFEREYLEYDDPGNLTYAEYHHTFGDLIAALRPFTLLAICEPEWPEELTQTWGQWSPKRGRIFPGTAIVVAELPTN